MITTVIFDIGNVLMRWNWRSTLARTYGEEKARLIDKAVFRSGLWNEMDRGVLTMSDVRERAIAQFPECATELGPVFDDLGIFAERCSYAIPWINELRAAGYRVLYLSNYSHDLINLRPDVLDFLTYMDGGVFSCNVHLTKPEPAIYAAICSIFRFKPDEGLFIDDNAANVEAAKVFGLNAIRFEEYEAVYSAVKDILKEKGLTTK